MKYLINFTMSFVFLFAVTMTGVCADKSTSEMLKASKNLPTKIVSDKMTYESKNLLITFLGNVHVTHGDMKLWTNKLLVILHPAKKNKGNAIQGMSPGEIKELRAVGNVRMEADKRTGTCGLAIYDVDAAVLTMKENPKLNEPGRSLVGSEIRYYSNEGRSEVYGTFDRRVEVFFQGPVVKSPTANVKKPKVNTGRR